MAAILGYVDLLEKNTTSPEQRHQYLDVIHRNGQHLLAILNDVLDLSKIEAGKMTVERLPFSPADVVAEVESLLRIRAMQKGIGFSVDIQPRQPGSSAIQRDCARSFSTSSATPSSSPNTEACDWLSPAKAKQAHHASVSRSSIQESA
jgi:signal transduction histidine kinase